MIDLTERARAICQELRIHGFGGISFHNVRVEEQILSDYWDADDPDGNRELTPEQFKAWTENRVSFIAEPDFPFDPYANEEDPDQPYVERTQTVNTTQFYIDLTAKVMLEMGPGVKVSFREGCFEFEAVRESYVHPVSMPSDPLATPEAQQEWLGHPSREAEDAADESAARDLIAASRSASSVNSLIEQLRDIYTGRETYNSEQEWLDNVEASLKELCAATNLTTEAFH